MDKENRKKGEKILIEWAEADKKIKKMQSEIIILQNGLKDLENFKHKFDKKIFNLDTNDGKSFIEIYIETLFEMIEKMKAKISKYSYIENIISELENYKKMVIDLRYKQGYSWEAVSLRCHTSKRNCFNIKNMVIEKILNAQL